LKSGVFRDTDALSVLPLELELLEPARSSATTAPSAISVLSEGDAMPIGVACSMRLVQHRRGSAQTFRLVVNRTEVPGLWVCAGRRFVPLVEAAAEL